MTLKEFFTDYPRVAIAFSGGVDSAFLLHEAIKYAKEVKAYYVKSEFQPVFEYEDALRLSSEIKADLKVINLNILSLSEVVSNPSNRCYFCKKNIFSNIAANAKADGFTILLDGTNASDDIADRPGMKALQELSVLSPLKMCNLTKDEIRSLSREVGLFTWNKPAYACLATRIPYGTIISADSLQKIELTENYLFSLGFTNFRIRMVGTMAKIQLTKNQLPLLMEKRQNIVNELKKYYSSVCLDLEVRDEH